MGTLLSLQGGEFGPMAANRRFGGKAIRGAEPYRSNAMQNQGSAATRANDDRIGDKDDEFLGRHQVPS
jgi:hypothetical protein